MRSFKVIELLWFIPHLICIPWSMYNTFIFYKHKDKIYVQKRSISVAFGFLFALLYGMISQIFVGIAVLYLDIQYLKIAYILICISFFLCLFYLNTRSWMIYYQYHWNYHTLQSKWQQIINPNFVHEHNQSNWFIKNKHKYGNLAFVYRFFGAFHTSACIICTVIIALFLNHSAFKYLIPLIGVTSCGAVVLFYCIIRIKTPSFNDMFYIHWEAKIVARILSIGVTLFFITGGLYAANVNNMLFGSIQQVIAVGQCFMLHYVCTIVIISKNNDDQFQLLKKSLSNVLSISSVDDKDKSRTDTRNVQLNDIISDENNLNAFMKYLSRELR